LSTYPFDVATARFDGLHVQTPLDDQAITHDKDRVTPRIANAAPSV
jgi:hypothetical protein